MVFLHGCHPVVVADAGFARYRRRVRSVLALQQRRQVGERGVSGAGGRGVPFEGRMRGLELALVLVVVAVQAEQFPVAAVRRIVVVIVVPVVDGELVDVGVIELARAAAADPREHLQGLAAIALLARVARLPGIGHDPVEAGLVGVHGLAGGHRSILAGFGRPWEEGTPESVRCRRPGASRRIINSTSPAQGGLAATLLVTISTLRRIVCPSWNPDEVRLLAGDEALLGGSDVFGDVPLVISQTHSSFTIARRLMQLPVPPLATGATASTRQPAGVPMPLDFKASAEQLIASLSIEGYPGIETAAEAAGLSPRTLQRRLAEVGLTYGGLVSASRLRLAKTWLTESEMPVAEIAATLGYSEATNFVRAFRRQTGISPAAFRRVRRRPH